MDVYETVKHMHFLARHLERNDFRSATIAILLEVGIPADHSGFEHLIEAISMYYDDPTLSFMCEIYPSVGKLYPKKANGQQVERTIRYAIEIAWRSRELEAWCRYFPPDRDGIVKKPTNAEFISRIARYLEIWHNCYWGGN